MTSLIRSPLGAGPIGGCVVAAFENGPGIGQIANVVVSCVHEQPGELTSAYVF